MKANVSEILIRDSTDDDVAAVRSIYAHHVQNGVASFEEVAPGPAEGVFGSAVLFLVPSLLLPALWYIPERPCGFIPRPIRLGEPEARQWGGKNYQPLSGPAPVPVNRPISLLWITVRQMR